MHLARSAATLLGVALLTAACGLVSGLDSLERTSGIAELPDANEAIDGAGQDAPGDDAGASPDAALDAAADGSEASADAAPDVSVTCATGMVKVDEFCIDVVEVSNAKYADFLTTHAAASSVQPAACSWNTDFTPATNSWPLPVGQANKPVTWVDWCDAHAYCTAQGKHLCGKIGGGANDPGAFTSATHSQWFAACSHDADGLHAFPYGNDFSPTACNGGATDDGGAPLTNVGSMAGCVGGFPGIFDLSGNAREWEDSCTPGATPDLDQCRVRGGGSDELITLVRCDADLSRDRNGPSAHTGFRCCSN